MGWYSIGLTSFTYHLECHALKVHPYCRKWQDFVLLNGWLTFRWTSVAHLYPSIYWWTFILYPYLGCWIVWVPYVFCNMYLHMYSLSLFSAYVFLITLLLFRIFLSETSDSIFSFLILQQLQLMSASCPTCQAKHSTCSFYLRSSVLLRPLISEKQRL